MTEDDKLRERVTRIRKWVSQATFWTDKFGREDIAAILDAAESTLPKTKMVEVWRVEYCDQQGMPQISQRMGEESAQEHARYMLKNEGASLVNITGPHAQTVPA